MLTKMLTLSLIVFLLTIFSNKSNAQSFGFGCLGFVGGYGGYSYQVYNPTGLNNYVKTFNEIRQDSLKSPMQKFGKAQGYRLGINFFRANIKGFILTTKAFYQLLSEKHQVQLNSYSGQSSIIYKLDITNWGFGIDLGTSLTDALSWKVLDAAVLFNTAKLEMTKNFPDAITEVDDYKSAKSTIGYSIGTGFILSIIDNYVSIEGGAGYSVFKIDKMQNNNGQYLTTAENSTQVMSNLITAGGFNAVIQLNVGFPL